jgi:hypothetical protein
MKINGLYMFHRNRTLIGTPYEITNYYLRSVPCRASAVPWGISGVAELHVLVLKQINRRHSNKRNPTANHRQTAPTWLSSTDDFHRVKVPLDG